MTLPDKLEAWAGFDDVPDLDPVLATETTEYGWRGITGDGEVLEVRSHDGSPPSVPESIMVYRAGKPIGRRATMGAAIVDVSAYLNLYARAVNLHKAGENERALDAINAAIGLVDTTRARFNRALILLGLGRWRDGIEEMERCERRPPFARPLTRDAIARGIRPWSGEPLDGKRLLLLSDHGLGDTLMMLRYVPALRLIGADVVMMVPPELARVAAQLGTVTANTMRVASADYFVSFLHLLRHFAEMPVPVGPYVMVDPRLRAEWEFRLGSTRRRRVGVAWSVGRAHDGDYPREIRLEEMLRIVGDAEVHSVQVQGGDEAAALGVATHRFIDLADCAALMSLMDEIVTVDTAAIHLAGAIGHPRATVLLSKWRSWRWRENKFYPEVAIGDNGR